ncbi:putative regulator of Ras-like GTPase activity (Roadblock/LC7/MglB family) [Dokdonella fugitiva]|uniref:Putative regulator of Ras-like GTPase activity (Roadblock/LC7/MglB family) n=1 Tax=Dokdonella fugitiva TaxID=328517 RepID=A0A839EX42_9GAMM|nr:roadblock/LC7 domain-containing protein [Dokdonella fugitiva]MBA8886332.1 putative regulator of Ras-like GTPase activity (Roadblock/LC7/MglB family) [Dokdonella fugitiva]
MSKVRPAKLSRELARKVLEGYGEVAGVQCAVLFSSDGFEIASHAADAAASARLAAIGSSLAALGTALAGEAGLGDFERTTIESNGGAVTIMRVGSSRSMSLAVVAGKDAVLGQLLWATQRCCQALAKLLDP